MLCPHMTPRYDVRTYTTSSMSHPEYPVRVLQCEPFHSQLENIELCLEQRPKKHKRKDKPYDQHQQHHQQHHQHQHQNQHQNQQHHQHQNQIQLQQPPLQSHHPAFTPLVPSYATPSTYLTYATYALTHLDHLDYQALARSSFSDYRSSFSALDYRDQRLDYRSLDRLGLDHHSLDRLGADQRSLDPLDYTHGHNAGAAPLLSMPISLESPLLAPSHEHSFSRGSPPVMPLSSLGPLADSPTAKTRAFSQSPSLAPSAGWGRQSIWRLSVGGSCSSVW